MEHDCYIHPSNKGEIKIRRNHQQLSRWDLLIDEKLVCAALFYDPHQAAACVFQREFGSEQLNREYIGLRGVSDDLEKWRVISEYVSS